MSVINALMPRMFSRLGKRHVEMASHWVGTSAAYGASGALALCYFTEWKAVLQYLPYYGGKYVDSD